MKRVDTDLVQQQRDDMAYSKRVYDGKEIISCARKRISDPSRWTTKAYAKTKTGKEVEATSRYAQTWCAVGATRKCFQEIYPGTGQERKERILWDVRATLNEATEKWILQHKPREIIYQITEANDRLSHQDVLDIFDYALGNYPTSHPALPEDW